MTKWTKADIDELLERRPLDMREPDFWASKAARMSLYLAAGLTADGQTKPAKIPAWLGSAPNGNRILFLTAVDAETWHRERGYAPIAGMFVPDGAE